MVWYVVDGMDGSGKSTVAGILKGELEARGRSVLVIAHPNRDTVVGRMELRFCAPLPQEPAPEHTAPEPPEAYSPPSVERRSVLASR